MAFKSSDLSVLAYANTFTLWHFKTVDTVAEVIASNYFDKAAIAHVELLIKLAKWADLPDETGHREEDVELALLLANAEAELKKIQKD